jgi:shikimate kinase
MQNIVLVGPMGAGKSTVGRGLALLLKRAFLDSDQEIEKRTGVDIPTIFEFEGEEGFRHRETEMLRELLGIVTGTDLF